jgi:calcineurin-like phosphoesterase family protein
MNQAIIENINAVVQPDDIYWHLGDFAWKDPQQFIAAIRCKHIHIVLGNHDRPQLLRGVRCYPGLVDLKLQGQKVTLCHYPMRSWRASYHGAWHLYGHVHGRMESLPFTLDVGVDSHDFRPWSWNEICDYMKRTWAKTPAVPHHP